MFDRKRFDNLFGRVMMTVALALAGATLVAACPFCSVESRTLTEEISASETVVLAKLIADAPPIAEDAGNENGFGSTDPDSGKATFQIVNVLRGEDRVKVGDEIKVVYFGEGERDKTFMISGIGVENNGLEWTTPLPLSATAIEYIRKLPDVPATGAERLVFFQDYLENDDPLLAQDAYDEFARAPYAELHELKGHMFHDRLVEWIQSPDVNPSRRRLYLTMLGVCGDNRDLPMLEGMIVSDYSAKKPILDQMVALGQALGGPFGLDMWTEMVDLEERQKKLGLDASVACYLTLHGPDGLDLIDERFLKNPKVEYTHAYMTIMALRFHGEEGNVVPKERLLQSMRLLLDNPEFADQVIPDLARWEDWSVLDRLTEMYKNGDEKSYVRQPVVTYLTVASEQPGDVGTRAKAALAELEKLDPEGVKKAQSLMAFGFLARARSTAPATGATRPDTKTGSDATTQADVATTGFEASAADRAGEAADASDIPEPEGFGETPDETELSDDEPTESATDEAEEAVASEVEAPPEPTAYSRPIVIGIPLASALVLMTVYWMILRWGAM
ncbi:MAG: hypothetical protein WD971_02705 [Pirellulales bacterium]